MRLFMAAMRRDGLFVVRDPAGDRNISTDLAEISVGTLKSSMGGNF
jgi:hypothetical protein